MKPIFTIYFLTIASLAAQAPDFPFAPGIADSITNNRLWDDAKVKDYVKNTLRDPEGGDIPTRDNAADPSMLGDQCDEPNKTITYSGTLDLTKLESMVKISILVDDVATLTVTGAGGFNETHTVNGSALWRPQSFKTLPLELEPGKKYNLKLVYQNVANLTNTKPYAGKVDVDGVSVYISASNKKWFANSKDFKTGKIAIPGVTGDVEFDSVLKWEELKEGEKIYRLRNPSLTINGTKLVRVTSSGTPYDLKIEIEGYTSGDVFKINDIVVGGVEYNTATGDWVLGKSATTTTVVGGKNVNWTWKSDVPQPKVVEIISEGDVIELKHTSPNIVVREAFNPDGSAARIVNAAGDQIYPGSSFKNEWKMKHKITITP